MKRNEITMGVPHAYRRRDYDTSQRVVPIRLVKVEFGRQYGSQEMWGVECEIFREYEPEERETTDLDGRTVNTYTRTFTDWCGQPITSAHDEPLTKVLEPRYFRCTWQAKLDAEKRDREARRKRERDEVRIREVAVNLNAALADLDIVRPAHEKNRWGMTITPDIDTRYGSKVEVSMNETQARRLALTARVMKTMVEWYGSGPDHCGHGPYDGTLMVDSDEETVGDAIRKLTA